MATPVDDTTMTTARTMFIAVPCPRLQPLARSSQPRSLSRWERAAQRGAYCRAMATRRRSSGSMKWSWSSSPTSICTQWILPVKRLVRGGVVGGDGGAGLVADVGRLVGGEDHRLGGLDPAGADCGAVVVEGDVAALGEPAAVVGELHAHLVRARRGSACRPRWRTPGCRARCRRTWPCRPWRRRTIRRSGRPGR